MNVSQVIIILAIRTQVEHRVQRRPKPPEMRQCVRLGTIVINALL